MAALNASAQSLKPANADAEPFAKDLIILAYSNDDSNWGVGLSLTDQFRFDGTPTVGVSIGSVHSASPFFDGLMLLHKNEEEHQIAPSGHGMVWLANSKTLESMEITIDATYKHRPVSVTVRFVVQDGKPTGYEVALNDDMPEAEQGGAGRPATSRESDSEGADKSQPEAEGSSR
ncbi:hypothetical protein HAHE_24350 [Haloferula helveola]|uniref:Uncharacterized protein n=2 Tax=Haloferula helveola TaxID=490095 RepID=A0ABM7RL72_9BACT|nr:hypothetical protein HAHE_24350 [Haloferula helveola]